MNAVLTSDKKETSVRWKKVLSAMVLGAVMLAPALSGQAFAQSQTKPALSTWGDRDRHDNDRRGGERHDNDRRDNDRHDWDRRDNDRRHDDRSRHDRYDHRDNDRNRYDRDRRHDGRYDNRRDNRWDWNDRNRYDYRPGYGYGYGGNDYNRGSYTSLRGVVLDVSERSGYARVRGDNGRIYTVRADRHELDNLRRGERVTVRGRFQGNTVYANDIDER